MSEQSLIITFAIGDVDIYGDIEGENPCVSIREEPGSSDKDCGGGAVGVVSSLLAWVNGGDISTEDTSGDSKRIFSSSALVQDISGTGYSLGSVGSALGDKKIESRELTDVVHMTPDDVVDGIVDLTSGLLGSIPDKILSVSVRGGALDDNFNKIHAFTSSWTGGFDLEVSHPAYASFTVRYLATVDAYGVEDSGDGGYGSILYSVGACGRVDDFDVSAGRCFQDDFWRKYGYPWEQDGDTLLTVTTPPPEAEESDATIIYDFCTKMLIRADPPGIVPDGSCWGGKMWPSGEICTECKSCE